MLEDLTLTGALILQISLTAYYIYFIIRPLCEIEKISGKINYGYRLLIIRIIGITILDILDYRLAILLDIAALLVLALVITPKIKKELNYAHSIDTKLAKYDEVTDEELSAHGIKNRKVLEDTLFKKLNFIQIARTKYDYDTLKRLCTDKMYNLFANELQMVDEVDLEYHYEDYKLVEMQIYEISSTEKELKIKAAIKANCIFYRESPKGEILDGSKENRTILVHEVEYIKNIDLKDIDTNCPNCGAPTKTTTRGKCSYCNTIIKEEFSGWQVSAHKIIAEKIAYNNE